MRRAFMPPLAACIWLALPTTGTAADTGQRFAVRGEVRALGLSDDRRFALSAELRQTPEVESEKVDIRPVEIPRRHHAIGQKMGNVIPDITDL